MISGEVHHTSFVMLLLLVIFAIIHSGGAALRSSAESVIGARAWRLFFALVSIPSAAIVVIYFLLHRYDGIQLWDFHYFPALLPFVWSLSAISFLFLYPATYNLLEIPAVLKPKVRLYATGIIRISRHPQAIGQIIWCFAHLLWLGNSFVLVTCFGLIAHHLFAIWHGDRRLEKKFGDSFRELKQQTSVIPFLAVIDGRQELKIQEFLRPSQLGICIAVGLFWWIHRYIPLVSQSTFLLNINELFS